MRERLIELLSRYFTIGDSYAYNLTRVKESFAVGTVSLEDFEEFDENVVGDIADHLLEHGVIALPCKIGDKIWLVYSPRWPAIPGDKGKWFMAEDGVQRILYGAKGMSIETWNLGAYNEKEIGKKIFLTKEGAEAELQRRKEKNNGQN